LGILVNEKIIEDILKADFRAIARLITLVESGAPEAVPFLRALYRHSGRCLSIGITGAPGSGKSTLVDKLAGYYRDRNKRVGIIAIDPTSPFTGGAILGDRIRMQSRALDEGTFIRSMATRGTLGGLARSTADVLLILDAAGFDVVLIETVGVGQDEVEVARTAHVTLVLLVPGMGDDVQAMKAGIMEIADIFVINKADHAGLERMETELNALLGIPHRRDRQKPQVVKTVASEGKGIDDCAGAIDTWLCHQKNSGMQKEKAVEIHKGRLLDLVHSEIQRGLMRRSDTAGSLARLARLMEERQTDPYSAADELIGSWRFPVSPRGWKIDHVAVAVRSLEAAAKSFGEVLGLTGWVIEEIPEQKTRVAVISLADSHIELLEAMAGDSPVASFLAKRGEGLHHICFEVQDLDAELARLEAAGVRLIDRAARMGAGGCRIAFLHPSGAAGVLIELSQPGGQVGTPSISG
jgi:LAO/AO transport system kinase